MTTSITAFPITAKQIAELTSAASAAGTDFLMAQQGTTGTPYRKMTVAQVMGSGAAVLASRVTVNAATVPANGVYLPAANTLGLAVNTVGEVQLTASAFSPITSDGNALGTTSLMWSDAFLASGAVINFNAGNYTLTHSAGLLTASGTITIGSAGNTLTITPNATSGTAIALAGGGTGGMTLATSGSVQWAVTHTASAVNYVSVTGGVTGTGANVSALGSDGNIALILAGKGTGKIRPISVVEFGTSGNTLTLTPNTTSGTAITLVGSGTGGMTFATSGGVQLAVGHTASAVNYVSVTGAGTGVGPKLSAVGSDAVIHLRLSAKSSGSIIAENNIVLSATRVLVVDTLQVVGPRDTGWTAMTGTADEVTSYATSSITLAQLAGRVMALQTALTTHGLIGT